MRDPLTAGKFIEVDFREVVETVAVGDREEDIGSPLLNVLDRGCGVTGA